MGLGISGTDKEWRSKSKCWVENMDPNYFFVDGSETTNGRNGTSVDDIENERKVYCNDCTVLNECLGWALATNQEFGILGGTSSQDRKRIKRRTQRVVREAAVKSKTHRPVVVDENKIEAYVPKFNRQDQAS